MVGLGFSYNNQRLSKGTLFHVFLSLLLILQLLTSVFLLAPAKQASAATPWYNFNWDKRKTVTFTASAVKIPSSQTDFPVLISILDTSLQANAQADGDDILFTSSNGTTKLAHEIEKYNPATGELQAWVKVPTLATSGVIYMYFGYSGAANQQNINGVWDANFKAVYHSNDKTTTTIDDSTLNNNDGTKIATNQPIEAPGKIGQGQDFDGVNDAFSSAIGAITAPFTVEAWGYFDLLSQPAGNFDYLFMMGNGTSNNVSFSRNALDNRFYSYSENSQKFGPALGGQQWLHIVGVYKTTAPYQNLYINGTAVAVDDFSTAASVNGAFFGGQYNPSNTHFLDGKVDEIRISNANRSSDWITSSYNNQNDPATFYALGSLELFPTPATGLNTTALISLAFISLVMGMMMIFRTKRAFFNE